MGRIIKDPWRTEEARIFAPLAPRICIINEFFSSPSSFSSSFFSSPYAIAIPPTGEPVYLGEMLPRRARDSFAAFSFLLSSRLSLFIFPSYFFARVNYEANG